MKRYLLRPDANDKIEITPDECETPSPGTGEVVVKMAAASLNYRDLLMRSGKSASGGDDPVVPLSDGAGEVVEVGAEVTKWKAGDRVALTFFRDWEGGRFSMENHKSARGGSCDGVLAEYVAAPEHSLVRIPDYLSDAEAATLPCAAVTAWHAMMERGNPVGPGDSVLCLGTGGVSIFALQIAKAAGARVIVTSSSDQKIARALELGADASVNYREFPDWDRKVYEITENQGVDHVIEVGGPGTLEKSMSSAGAGATISQIGVLTGFDAPDTSLFPLVTKNVNLNGIYVGSRAMFENLLSFLETHEIHPVIDKRFSFAEAASAYDCLEDAGHFGKIVIEF